MAKVTHGFVAWVSQNFLALGGWFTALAVAVVGALVQWRKGSVDESVAVLGEWKKLLDTHQKQLEMMQVRIDGLVRDNADLRLRLDSAEKRIRELEDENAGLKRAIIQNSRSTAIQIGKRARGSNREELP